MKSCDQEELAKVDSASKGQALDDAPEEASVKSKAQQKKFTKPDLPTGRSGKRNILGCTAMIHKRECFANYARSVEIHLQQPGVHGLLEE